MNRFIPTAAFELRHAAPERTLWTLADTHFRTVPAWGFGDATAAVRPDQSVIAAPASESTRIESSETRSSNTSQNLDELDLLRTPVVRLFSVRAVWLVLLTLFGMLTSTAVAAQTEMLEHVILLAAFIAPIVDMGGNAGSQSATLVIRALSTGTLQLCGRDLARVLGRELLVSGALGAVVALLEGLLAWMTKDAAPGVLCVVALSMFVCTAASGVIGALLPFVAKRCGLDPATLSSPLITSVMDLLGVFIYFGLAYLFLADVLFG